MHLSLQGSIKIFLEIESILEVGEIWSRSVSASIEASDQHGKVGAVMEASLALVVEEVKSLIVVEALQALLGSLMFLEELPATIESTSPTAASLVPSTRVFAPHWVTGEGSSSMLDCMKARKLLLGSTPPVYVIALWHMSMEEVLACIYHYIIGIYGISFEGRSHNLCYISTLLMLQQASMLKHWSIPLPTTRRYL